MTRHRAGAPGRAAPAQHPPAWAYPSALGAGTLGLIANAFLVGFFALTYPYSADPRWGWLGTANDVALIGFFVALIPVALAVRRMLPANRAVAASTALAVVALAALAALQLALVGGLISFEVQVLILIGLLVPVYGWLIVVGSVGHRTNALPRSVTRFALLIGISWPAALALTLAAVALHGDGVFSLGLRPPGGLLLVPALVLGCLNWLALPLWPVVLARTVFGRRPPAPTSGRLMPDNGDEATRRWPGTRSSVTTPIQESR